jgi:hypothetical protein
VIGLIQSMAPEWMISVWLRSSMNHAIHASIFYLHIKRNRCTIFFQCDWFDPIHGTRVDDFSMVEVKHESRNTSINLLLAHQAQQVYYLSYPQWISFSPKWCSTQAVEGRSTMTRRTDERCILGLVMFGF